MAPPRPYPLRFKPLLFEKVWGGRRLESWGKPLPPGAAVGESWEVADLAATSVSGAGGAPARSVIDNGPLAGRTLHDAMDLWGPSLLGGVPPAPGGGFPLLIKLLDACENLSVQVHPSPRYAAAHPGAHLKTECWIVLAAEPGSKIYRGLRPGVARDDVRRAVAAGTLPELLDAVPARPGECHTLPSGTVHALGAGVLVAEVQTPSDTTFRLFDWGRSGRALHVREALECIETAPPPAPLPPPRLAQTARFAVDAVRLAPGPRAALPAGCTVLIGVRGAAAVTAGGAPETVRPGTTLLIPEACAAWATVDAPQGFDGLAVTPLA